MKMTSEEQYLHDLIEGYVKPLRDSISELRQQSAFSSDHCSELAEGILTYIKDQGYDIVKNNIKPHDIAKQFADKKLKTVNTLLSEDYKIGYREGVAHFIEQTFKIK